ncbi:MAG TPA: glycosyltransferase family 1 protein [Burkholderiaceae bacterium]
MTGVQRYASSLLHALDARLAARLAAGAAAAPWTLLLPAQAPAPALRAIAVRRVPWRGPGGLHGWEQAALPRAARGGRLINLAGSAPAFGVPSQVCVMHDAAPFDQPQAYTRVFRHWYRWLFRHLARRPTTALVTVSAFSRERLVAALGVPRERFTIVAGAGEHLDGGAADTALLAAQGLDRQPFVLAVGSRNPTKNLARLLQAWRLLGRADLRLVLVGGVNPQVFHSGGGAEVPGVIDLGTVDDATLKALYQRALALVFPSLYEGFGLPLLEAMHNGCPVVASNAAAVREVCGDAAVYCDALQPQGIADALREVIEQPARRDELRERGRSRAGQFGWDTSAQSLLQLVEATR